jgi:hypothetical protein
MTKVDSEILQGMARALWVHAYMNWVEMPPNMSGTWDEITPPTPAAALAAAQDLAKLITEDGGSIADRPIGAPLAWGVYVARACLGGYDLGGDDPWPHFEVHIDEGELVWDGEATQEHESAMDPGKRKRLERAGWRGNASDFLRNPAVPWPRARVQSLLFPTFKFTATGAKEWARAHGYRHASVDTTGAYHRIRQFDPDGAACRTIPFGDSGIKAIVCAARRNPEQTENVVLHLEDDPLIQRGMGRLLKKIFPGAEVITVDSVEAAKQVIADHPNLVAILSDVDLHPGQPNGLDFFDFVKATHPWLVDRYTFLTGGHPEVADMHYRYLSKGDAGLAPLRDVMTRPGP